MKILFACGGTGGHINPAIAIASTIRAKQPEAQILFAGQSQGDGGQTGAAGGV